MTAESLPNHIALHEAGHVVVAHTLGFTTKVETDDRGPRTDFKVPKSLSGTDRFLIVAVSMAGASAQKKGGSDPDEGCAQDLMLAVEDSLTITNESPEDHVGKTTIPAAAQRVLERAAGLAKSIIAGRWDELLALARTLEANNYTMSADEIDVALAPDGSLE